MANYTIELNYKSTIKINVEANDEGEALDKARDIAERADMNEFSIVEELPSRVVTWD